jgi:hypothetical protein
MRNSLKASSGTLALLALGFAGLRWLGSRQPSARPSAAKS